MFPLLIAAAAFVATVPEPSPPTPPSDVIDALLGQDIIVEQQGGDEFTRQFVEFGDLDTLLATDDEFRHLAVSLTSGDYQGAREEAVEHASALLDILDFSFYEGGTGSAIARLTISITTQCALALSAIAEMADDLQNPVRITGSNAQAEYTRLGERADLPGEINHCRIGIAVIDALV